MPLDLANHVRVWTMTVDEAALSSRLAEFTRLLSSEERDRMSRFFRVEDRVRFALTRSLLRVMLSRAAVTPVSPVDWRFRVTPHGRPELDGADPAARSLRFNVSHTRGLLACAVTAERDMGVDVEYMNRGVTHEIAERFFAPQEVADLRAMAPEIQPEAFFDYWTLKEAYIKARGLGLSIPLDQFAFTLQPGRGATIRFDPRLGDDEARWHFVQSHPTPTHRLAVAVRFDDQPPTVSIEPVTPEAIAA